MLAYLEGTPTMKLKSKLFALIAVLFAVALVAAACGNDDDDAPAAPPAPTAAPAEEPAEEPAPEPEPEPEPAPEEEEPSLAGTVVNILGPETGPEAEGFLAGFEPFEARTGIDVQYSGSRDATTELNLALEGGNPPDIVIIPQPGRIIQFGESGDAVALPQSLLDNIGGAYDPFWFDLATTGGQVYGVPNKGDVKSLVWYSPPLFAENGYEVPGSWDRARGAVRADQVRRRHPVVHRHRLRRRHGLGVHRLDGRHDAPHPGPRCLRPVGVPRHSLQRSPGG